MTIRQVKVREIDETRLTLLDGSRRPGSLPHPFLPIKAGRTRPGLPGLSKTIKEPK